MSARAPRPLGRPTRALRAGLVAGLLAGLLAGLCAGCGDGGEGGDAGTGESPAVASAEVGAALAAHDPGAGDPDGRDAAAWRQRERELLDRIDDLQDALRERDERLAQREREMLAYTQAIASLPVPGGPGVPGVPGFLETPEDPAERLVREQEARAEAARRGLELAQEERVARRAEQVRLQLRALLMAERVHALDVLEVGRPGEGFTGPVVVRLVDDRGRPSGMLAADRLRLECSRAGRVLTLVFEEGYELVAGRRVPFGPSLGDDPERGGVRRIRLDGVDPEPWIEALPDLFDLERIEEPLDDGLWNPILVRQAVNELLRTDESAGAWRLTKLGGVVAGALRAVQLAELDPRGQVLRILFADELLVEAHGQGVRLTLREGVQERAGVRTPFVDGRLRLHLPRADAELGRAKGVPGLARPLRD